MAETPPQRPVIASPSFLVTLVSLAGVAIWQATRDRGSQALYPITLAEIIAGNVLCPSISADYRPDHGAVGEKGFFHGEIFIDARGDLATCDEATVSAATRRWSAVPSRSSVLETGSGWSWSLAS